MRVIWNAISAELYSNMRRELFEKLTVFSTITRMEDGYWGDRKIMTEWGIKDSALPIIKYLETGDPEDPTIELFLASYEKEACDE